MANHYTMASFMLPVASRDLTHQRMTALANWMNDDLDHLPTTLFSGMADDIERDMEDRREFGLGFHWSMEPEGLWISHDESIDVENAVAVLQVMLELEGNDDAYILEWANTCDKPRVGEFGGGVVAFNRHGAAWMSTSDAGRSLVDKLKKELP